MLSRAIGNQPPVVTLLPVRNQAGAMIDGYVSGGDGDDQGHGDAGRLRRRPSR
ncbi:MAG: hypothetical protein HS111_29030 [Kofleriaceae bacterium]|nr:hypothetical protein [Kofleriaceae bacterium]